MGQHRYRGLTKHSKAGPVWTGELRPADEALTIPLRRRKPTVYFVNSMSDLGHESLPDAVLDRVFAVMALAPRHTFQVLTKRSARMRAYGARRDERGRHPCMTDAALMAATGRWNTPALDLRVWPLPNVWLGVSAEDQRRADERVPDLLATPAAVRFVSAEPLLSGIDFTRIETANGGELNALTGRWAALPIVSEGPVALIQTGALPALSWIIVGGESGSNARPFQTAWAQAIVDQCASAGVPCFVKQLGDRPMHTAVPVPGRPPLTLPLKVSRKGKDMAEWPASLRVRQTPAAHDALPTEGVRP